MTDPNIDERLKSVGDREEERHHWVVIFSQGGRAYTYTNRTVPYMTEVIKESRAKHGRWPHRVWVIVDDEMERVIIE